MNKSLQSSVDSRVIVIGEVLVDRFEDGHEVVGGAPMNVAWNLRGMSLEPWFVSALGDDATGARITDVMTSFGLGTRGIQRVAHPTGFVRVEVVDGEPHYDIRTDVAYDHIDAETAVDVARRAGLLSRESGASGNNGVLYHGSLCYRSPATRRTIDRMKSEFDGDVFFDINIREGHFEQDWLDDLMSGVTILKCNWDEMRLLGRRGPTSTTDASDVDAMMAAAGEIVDRYSLKYCLLTAGGDGAHYIGRDGEMHSVATPTIDPSEFGDAVGAGDAFAARAIAGHVNAESPQQTLAAAVQHAARVCTLRGATTTDRSFYPKV